MTINVISIIKRVSQIYRLNNVVLAATTVFFGNPTTRLKSRVFTGFRFIKKHGVKCHLNLKFVSENQLKNNHIIKNVFKLIIIPARLKDEL